MSLALAYVQPDVAATGTALEVEVLRERLSAKVIESSPYDPENTSLRS
jgi:dimethylglycine dehydrogenase